MQKCGLSWWRWTEVTVILGVLLSAFPGPAASAEAVVELTQRITTSHYLLQDQLLSVPGIGMNDTPGAPQLPVYGTVFELPPTGDWELAARTIGSYTLAQRPAIPAVPVPDLAPPGPEGLNERTDMPDMIPTVDQPDPAIYQRDAFYPAASAVAGDVQWQDGRRLLAVRVFPFQYNPVTRDVRYHPEIEVTVRVEGAGVRSQGSEVRGQGTGIRGQESVVATAPAAVDGAVRIRTGARGMHRLTYADLLAAGVPVDADPPVVNPQSFTMTYLGQPIPIRVTGEADGVFDANDLVIFYAEPYVGRYMTHNVYWLYHGAAAAPVSARMAVRDTAPSGGEAIITAITQTLHVEFDRIYPDNPNWPIPTDADHWFDQKLDVITPAPVRSLSYSLLLDDHLTEGTAQVRGLLYGGANQAANPDQSVAVALNGRAVDTYQWEGRTPYAFTATVPAAWLDQNPSQLTLEAALAQLPGLASYYVHPDWVEISYGALADAEGDRFYAEGVPTGGATRIVLPVTGFTVAAVHAYDVRDPRALVQITSLQVTDAGGSYTVQVTDAWDVGDPPPAYALTTDAALLAPLAVERDNLTAWRSAVHQADYIAIVHRDLRDTVQPLLDRRAAQGLHVAKIDVQDIYDEFSHGLLHPEAIRAFLTYAYHNWNVGGIRPRYVTLVGNGHYDFKRASGTKVPNYIPPYLADVDPWWGETAADNRYVSIDGPDDYMPDMALGRIPARTPAALTEYINKVIAYENLAVTSEDPWNNRVNFVADNCADSAGNFHALSDEVRLNWLPDSLDDSTIYYGSTNTDNMATFCPGSTSQTNTPTGMNTQIKNAFNAGAVLLQWFGHASRFRWGSVSYIYNYTTPPALDANTRLPLVVAYSCWDGYYIDLDPVDQALGAIHVMQPGRAAIATFSPTGLHLGSALSTLNQGLMLSLFRDRIRSVGEATTQAKRYYFANSSSSRDVIDTQMLLGDPALKLHIPITLPTEPVTTIEVGGAGVTLRWLHQLDSAQYEVWRGTTPYFDPAAGQGVPVTTRDAGFVGRGASFTFGDDGSTPLPAVRVIGDTDTNYFWVLRSRNGDGVSAPSNRVGEFDFALVPGE